MPCKNTAALLKALADKYETPDFLTDDPSQFMHRFADPVDQELFAFVAAQLAFGKRELFIAKLNKLYDAVMDCKPKTARAESEGKLKTAGAAKSVGKPKTCGASFAGWLASGGHQKFFPKSQKKFYRFFSYADMNALCGRLAQIVEEHGSLGAAVRARYGQEIVCKPKTAGGARCGVAKSSGNAKNEGTTKSEGAAPLGLATASGIATVPPELRLVAALISLFPGVKCVSQNPKGACKKLHMFLRWMVRRGSPVDLGLWDWASAADLLMPLDTHVLQESARLGLIAPNAAASAKTAIELTKKMAQVFAGDPTRADYALFGLGVDGREKR